MGKLVFVFLLLAMLAAADGEGFDNFGGGGAAAAGQGDIPADYLRLYRSAARTCAALDWPLLAAVGKVESDHGRSTLPGVSSGTNHAGAAGPMQFLAPTFAEVRANHPDVGPNVYAPAHAIAAAAHYLCDGGLNRGDVRAALWTYNPSSAYADKVLAQAATYRSGGTR